MRPRRLRRFAGILVLSLSLGGCAHASTAPPQTTADPLADQIARSQTAIEKLDPNAPGCSFAVARNGTVVWAATRGLANASSHTPLDAQSTFDLGSASEPFTAFAALLLAAEDKLDLNATIDSYVRGLPAWGRQVTLDNLIHHTSGIPDYIEVLTKSGTDFSQPATQASVIEAISKMKTLDSPPGELWVYSSSNYVLLAQAVQAASNQDFGDLLRGRIFKPLAVDITVDPLRQSPHAVTAHHLQSDGTLSQVSRHWSNVGNEGVEASPSEVVKWADNYRTGKVGGPTALHRVTEGAVPAASIAADAKFAAGFFISGDNIIGRPGGMPGIWAEWLMSADRTTAYAIGCSTDDDSYISPVSTTIIEIWL